MNRATWKHPKRMKAETGSWRYYSLGGYFEIYLDSKDPVTGQERNFRVYGDVPEWGKYRRI